MADSSTTTAHEAPLSGMRRWFAVYIAWALTLTGLALYAFARYEAGAAGALWPWILALMAFYLSLCNALLPLPTAWIVLFAASDAAAPTISPLMRIGVVATVGALATAMANLNEYHVLSHRRGAALRTRIRATRVYGWAAAWFDRAPFGALCAIAFIPLPVDVIRWLAILRRYPRGVYALAYFLGRLPRYALFAGFSTLARLGPWEILGVQAALLLAAGAGRLLWQLDYRHRAAAGVAAEDADRAPDVT